LKKEASSFRRFAIFSLLILVAILIVLLLWQDRLPGFSINSNATLSPTPGLTANPANSPASGASTTPTNPNSGANSSPAVNPVPNKATPTPQPILKLETIVLNSADKNPVPGAVLKKPDGTELAKADTTGHLAATNLTEGPVVLSAPGFAPTYLTISSQPASPEVQLKPLIFKGTLLDAANQQPIAGKLVRGGDKAAITDAGGQFSFSALPAGSEVKIDLIGYEMVEKTVEDKDQEITLALHSTIFDGSLADAVTKKPVANALIQIGQKNSLTNEQGEFHFSDAPHAPDMDVTVRAAGYKIQTFKAADLEKGAAITPFHFRGVYVPGVYAINANYDNLFTPYLKMADEGQINAIVLGVKDDDTGLLWYNSQVPLAKELGLVYNLNKLQPDQLMDVKRVLADAHKHGLYVVARYVVFRDPAIASKKPEWAIKSKKTGQPWLDDNGLAWPNQFIPEVGDYNAALARELSDLGFDEVNYDYIRFPTDGALSDIQYKPDLDWTTLSTNEKLRTDTIENAVNKAWQALRTTHTFFSLDVFGYSLWRVNDADGIGQQYNDLVMMSDYICPMVYASLFSVGEMGFDDPGAHPREIIEESGKIANKLEEQLKPIARYRPWLEDYDKLYGPKSTQFKSSVERVKVQIVAADSLGASGWTLWNANGDYMNQALADTAPPKT
jgi:hypothetical protein